MKGFGANLKRLRKEKGLKQQDLASMLGVERPTVANWERGAKYPGLPLLAKLSEALGVSADALLGLPPAEARGAALRYVISPTDPLVRDLACRTGVPAQAIAAFVTAMKAGEEGSKGCQVRAVRTGRRAARHRVAPR